MIIFFCLMRPNVSPSFEPIIHLYFSSSFIHLAYPILLIYFPPSFYLEFPILLGLYIFPNWDEYLLHLKSSSPILSYPPDVKSYIIILYPIFFCACMGNHPKTFSPLIYPSLRYLSPKN